MVLGPCVAIGLERGTYVVITVVTVVVPTAVDVEVVETLESVVVFAFEGVVKEPVMLGELPADEEPGLNPLPERAEAKDGEPVVRLDSNPLDTLDDAGNELPEIDTPVRDGPVPDGTRPDAVENPEGF